MGNFAIAIDGPAGSGKSTIAKKLSEILNIDYIDTGAMYRAFALKIHYSNIDINNKSELNKVLNSTEIDYKNNHIYLDGRIVDDEIRKNEISASASNIAKLYEVREKLVEIQRNISNGRSIIMDGRDIGSVVLPDAEYKFYITASIEERGKRRYKELIEKGYDADLDKIIKDIEIRDSNDSTRKHAPLVKCKDAIEVDTTNKTIDEVISEILRIIDRRNQNVII